MKFFRAIFIFFILASQISSAQSPEKWTLERCIDYALKNNISVRQAAMSAQISDNQHLQSKLNLLPSVDAGVGYNLNYGNSLNPITYNFESGNAQSAQINMQGNFTVFNGLQQIYNIQKAKYDLLAAKYDYENAKSSMVLNVASSYLQILLNREILQVAEKQKGLSAAQKATVESKIKVGALAENAIYDVDAQLSRDEANVVNAKGTGDISVLSLKQLLQLTGEQPFEIYMPDISADDMQGIADVSSLSIYNYAVTTQPSVKSAEARWRSANASRKIALGTITPTLSAFFNLSTGYASNDRKIVGFDTLNQQLIYTNTPFREQLKNDFRKMVGISLNIPLFGKGQRFIGISNAKLQQQIRQLDLESTKNRLRQDIEQAYANAKAGAESYIANKKSFESATKAYNALEKRFQSGLITSFDLQQSKNTLASAESEMIKAKYTYVFRLKILDFYQGKAITLN